MAGFTMSDFPDVERFAREHAACGGLTPSAMPRPGGGGYLLTLTCVCGGSFDRWVSPEEARRPLPIPSRAAPPAAASAPPAAPPAPPAPAAPAPPPARRPPAPSTAKPRASEELEALVREALAAEETPAAPSAAATAPAASTAEAGRPAARTRTAPERLNLDTTIRSALQQQAELTMPSPPRPRRGSRGRAVWLVLFIVAGLGAAGAIYVAGGPDAPLSLAPSGPPPPPRTADPQRAALEGVVKSLRELHSVATSTTSVSVYSTRVMAAKSEAERYMGASPPGTSRTRVREALDIHLLAVSAWRAKSLDQKDAWEAVGLDPSVDLCPPLRLVADFSVQAENVSRAQTRGAAVASALPLLWECANERIAALEQTLATR